MVLAVSRFWLELFWFLVCVHHHLSVPKAFITISKAVVLLELFEGSSTKGKKDTQLKLISQPLLCLCRE